MNWKDMGYIDKDGKTFVGASLLLAENSTIAVIYSVPNSPVAGDVLFHADFRCEDKFKPAGWENILKCASINEVKLSVETMLRAHWDNTHEAHYQRGKAIRDVIYGVSE